MRLRLRPSRPLNHGFVGVTAAVENTETRANAKLAVEDDFVVGSPVEVSDLLTAVTSDIPFH